MRHGPVSEFLAIASMIASLSATATAQDPPPNPSPPQAPPSGLVVEPAVGGLPAGAVARLYGRELSRAEYLEFLFRQYDLSQLAAFIDEQLVAQKANELGIEVSREQLNAVVEEKVRLHIEMAFGGQREQFLASLKRRLLTETGYLNWQRAIELSRLLVDRCILATREVSTADIEARFVQLYGAGGVSRQIRHLLIRRPAPAPAPDPADPRRPPPPTVPPEAATALATRVEEIRQQLAREPERFAELVRTHSDDSFTRGNDGFVPNYQPGTPGFGAAFDAAVARLEQPAEVVGPIETERGFEFIQLVKKITVRLEDVTEPLREELKNQRPTPKERQTLLRRLREAARVELDL
ncbi:MAG: peptidylprolyl isomerase [Planctomycetota bacterium]